MFEFKEGFKYKKQQYFDAKGCYYFWYLIDPLRQEGVHFHGRLYNNPDGYVKQDNKFGFYACGIEGHFKKRKHKWQAAIQKCDVTGGKCYCDGSSLQASERLGHINPNDNNHEKYIWCVLHEYFNIWILNKSEN